MLIRFRHTPVLDWSSAVPVKVVAVVPLVRRELVVALHSFFIVDRRYYSLLIHHVRTRNSSALAQNFERTTKGLLPFSLPVSPNVDDDVRTVRLFIVAQRTLS